MTAMVDLTDSTFVVNFRILPNRPKCTDISDFLTKKLGFELSELKHLQIIDSRVFVGTDSPQKAQDIVQEHNLQHQVLQDGKSYNIPLSMEDGAVEVRIHQLRPKINNQQVAQRMREYGEIVSIREDVWRDVFPGVPNGIRLLRMKLQKPIPSYITVENQRTLVTYKGQEATCKFCQRRVHFNMKCSEFAKTLKTASVNQRLTMAQVLKEPSGSSSHTHTTAQGNGGRLRKGVSHLASNISLADSEISMSLDPTESVIPPISSALDDQLANNNTNFYALLATDTEADRSSVHEDWHNGTGPKNQRKQQQQTEQKTTELTQSNNTHLNVKRPAGSPLDIQINDKRPSRSSSRSHDTRSSSKSKKH